MLNFQQDNDSASQPASATMEWFHLKHIVLE